MKDGIEQQSVFSYTEGMELVDHSLRRRNLK